MPLSQDVLTIPFGLAVLLVGTVAFVTSLTVMARVVDRLIDLAIAARSRQPARPSTSRQVASRPRRRSFAAVPRVVLAAMLAGSLLFALAWSAFVLGRLRDLG